MRIRQSWASYIWKTNKLLLSVPLYCLANAELNTEDTQRCTEWQLSIVIQLIIKYNWKYYEILRIFIITACISIFCFIFAPSNFIKSQMNKAFNRLIKSILPPTIPYPFLAGWGWVLPVPKFDCFVCLPVFTVFVKSKPILNLLRGYRAWYWWPPQENSPW